MNLSGESIRSMVDYYKIDPEQELLVIYDDINLGVGQLRIREKGQCRWTQRDQEYYRSSRNPGVPPHPCGRGRKAERV